MANLSNINNKLVVTTDGAALINQGTVDYGTAKLQVSGNGSTGTITWRNDGGRKTGYLYSDSTGVGIYTTALNNAGIYLADNLRIDFRVNGSERMRITPDGNSTFLIIKATPSTYSSSAFLSLYGTNSNTYGGSLVSRATIQAVTDGTAFGTKLKLLTNNASNVETLALTIDASQNVGIGTTLPTTALTIRKAIASQTYGEQASMIEFKSYFPAYDTETVKSAIYSGVSSQLASQTSKGFMSFWTSSQKVGGGQNLTEKMRIEADGKVGIGEDVPLKPLHVYAPDNGGNIRLTRAGTSEYKDISTYYSLTTGNESILGTTSAHNTFLWTNNYPALRITTAQEVCLLGFVGGDGFVLPQDQNTGYSNFAAGGFGVLFREAADNYIVGNAYYYRTGGVNGWRAKYPAAGATLISSNVGEFGFQTAVANTTAPYNISFTPRMIIKNNGVTTIGMTNATGAADVRIGFTGDATANGTGRLKFVNSNSYKSWQISAGGTPTGALAFTQSGTFGADNFNEERMRLASDGSVRIGKSTNYSMTSPYLMIGNAVNTNELILSNQGTTQLGGFDGSVIISTGGSNNLLISSDNGYIAFSYGVSNGYTSYNEAMRIASAGEIMLNITARTNPGQNNTDTGTVFKNGRMFQNAAVSDSIWGINGAGIIVSWRNSGVQVGTISLTSNSTVYSTSSDYRLKEDLKDFAGLDMVSKIPVYDFKWKTDESRSYGVMAHELQEVLPDAVTEEKDAEKMQGVDYSKIVPLLIKSIQELKAEIELLKKK